MKRPNRKHPSRTPWLVFTLAGVLAGCTDDGHVVGDQDSKDPVNQNPNDQDQGDGGTGTVDPNNPNPEPDPNPDPNPNPDPDPNPDPESDGGTDPTPGDDGALALCDTNFSQARPEDLAALVKVRNQVVESRDKWAKAPQRSHYKYSRSFASWTGYSCNMEVEFVDDKPVRLTQSTRDGQGVTDSFTVEGDQIASKQPCSALLTLDQLYDECLTKDLCVDLWTATYSAKIDPQDGILRSCEYQYNDCQDDCLEGFTIELTLL
jgi:hypothetical protein